MKRHAGGSPDLRLVPAAALCWVVVAWALAAPTGAVVAATLAAAGVALAAALAPAGRSRLRAHLVLAAAALCTTLAAAACSLAARSAGPFPRWVSQQAVAVVEGRVVGDPHLLQPGRWDDADEEGSGRFAVRLDLDRAAARGERRGVRSTALVLGDASWAAARVGSRIRVTGRLVPSRPGDEVAALFRAFGPPQELAPPAWWWRGAERVRGGLRAAVADRSDGPGGLLPSLVLGDTSLLTPAVEADLRASGLTHLTAVSGANVAIVTGGALWLAISVGLLRRARVVVAVAALAGFVVLARPEPSVVRAAAMGSVMLAGLLASRRSRGVPSLAGAVVALLVVDPWLARSAGFALSVMATAALLLLAPAWAARLPGWLPRPLALAVAAPAAAQAACAPLLVLLQPSISTVAVPANLLAGPAVFPATLLGVLAAVLALVWPAGAELLAAAGCLATWWIAGVAAGAAALPGAQVGWLPGAAGALVLAGLTVAGVLVSLRVPSERSGATTDRSGHAARPGGARGRRRRPGSAGRVLAIGTAVVMLVAAGWWLAGLGHRQVPGDWSVVMCDVGQGDAMVVRSGADRAVLVDTGPEPAAVRRCLDDLGVRHVDLLVLSHFHADHVGGLRGVLVDRRVASVLIGPVAEPSRNAEAVSAALAAAAPRAASARVVTAPMSGAGGSGGWAVRWRVPQTDPGEAGGPDGEPAEASLVNDASVVVLIDQTTPSGARTQMIALGDLELAGQSRLIAQLDAPDPLTDGRPWLDGTVDVVKVAHHGSARQDPELYRRLGAPLALIGVGAENDYGHPAPSALGLLATTGATVLRTDRDGMVAVSAYPAADPNPNGVVLTVHRALRPAGVARLLRTWFTAGLVGGRTS